MGIYLGGFDNEEDVIREFSNSWDEPYDLDLKGAEILYAAYYTGMYEGDAFVVIQRDGVMYSVEASHCSCYGLEGQWMEVETTPETLALRANADPYWGHDKDFHSEFKAFVNSLLPITS